MKRTSCVQFVSLGISQNSVKFCLRQGPLFEGQMRKAVTAEEWQVPEKIRNAAGEALRIDVKKLQQKIMFETFPLLEEGQ